MRIESLDAVPRRAGIARAEQPLRRRPGVPDARFLGEGGREPERVIDGKAARFRECRRPHGLLPRPSAIGRAEDRRAEMAGARGGEQRPAAAGIRHDVVDDVAEELRPGKPPAVARDVARERPESLAGGDEQPCLSRRRRTRRGRGTSHG